MHGTRAGRSGDNRPMSQQTHERCTGGERKLERAILLQLLGQDREQPSSHAQLAVALAIEADELRRALTRLSDAGVVCLGGQDVWASPAARRIDELGLIGI